MRIGLLLAPTTALAACAADQATGASARMDAHIAPWKVQKAEAAPCPAAEPTIESIVAMHRCFIENPRPIDLAVSAAAAEAMAACGGPVEIILEGDPADHGADPSDYVCSPR
jgi:hypothetical protein